MNYFERELLKAARIRIERGQNSYICIAMRDIAEMRGGEYYTAYRKLRAYINKALERHTSLPSWQFHRGIHRSPGLVRLDRLAWIDWMLGDITDEQLARMMKDWGIK